MTATDGDTGGVSGERRDPSDCAADDLHRFASLGVGLVCGRLLPAIHVNAMAHYMVPAVLLSSAVCFPFASLPPLGRIVTAGYT